MYDGACVTQILASLPHVTSRLNSNLQRDRICNVDGLFFFNQMTHLISHAQHKKPCLLILADVLRSVAIISSC